MRITDVFHTPDGKTLIACTGVPLGLQCSQILVANETYSVTRIETDEACFSPGVIRCLMEVDAETVPVGEFEVGEFEVVE